MIGRIGQREVFARLSKDGTYVRSTGLWCSCLLDPELDHAHLGYAIGRQVGGAVVRNRLKRQFRVLFEARSGQLRPGWYLVGVTPQVVGSTWDGLTQMTDRLIGQINTRMSPKS